MMTKAKLAPSDVIKTISNRTGLPTSMVKIFIEAYSDVVKEALLAQVEVPFGDVCFFTWKIVKPKEKELRWDNKVKANVEVRDVPGYNKMWVRPKKGWKKELREGTEFADASAVNDELEDEEEDNDELQSDDDNE